MNPSDTPIPRCPVTRGYKQFAPSENTSTTGDLRGNLLLYGVDSLELGMYYDFGDDWPCHLHRMEEHKQAARGCEHGTVFEVGGDLCGKMLPGGMGMYSYVVTTQFGQLRIAKQGTATSFPNVWVSCSAEGLRTLSLDGIEVYFHSWATALGGKLKYTHDKRTGELKKHILVNRMDLAADFLMSSPLTLEWLQPRKVARQTKWHPEMDGDRLETYYVGDMKKSYVLMRIYDKIQQMRVEPSARHVLEHWPEAHRPTIEGQIGKRPEERDTHVWRVEFEVKKPVLRQFGLIYLQDIAEQHQAIWRGLTEDWISFREDTEKWRTNVWRRQTSPFWVDVQNAAGSLEKAVRTRGPAKPTGGGEAIRRMASYATTFIASQDMAKLKEFEDFDEAWHTIGEHTLKEIGGREAWRHAIRDKRVEREKQWREWAAFEGVNIHVPTLADWDARESAREMARTVNRTFRSGELLDYGLCRSLTPRSASPCFASS